MPAAGAYEGRFKAARNRKNQRTKHNNTKAVDEEKWKDLEETRKIVELPEIHLNC